MSGLTHWHYVGMAYAATALVLGGLIVAVIADYRTQKRRLSALEAQGIRRASAQPASAGKIQPEAAR